MQIDKDAAIAVNYGDPNAPKRGSFPPQRMDDKDCQMLKERERRLSEHRRVASAGDYLDYCKSYD